MLHRMNHLIIYAISFVAATNQPLLNLNLQNHLTNLINLLITLLKNQSPREKKKRRERKGGKKRRKRRKRKKRREHKRNKRSSLKKKVITRMTAYQILMEVLVFIIWRSSGASTTMQWTSILCAKRILLIY